MNAENVWETNNFNVTVTLKLQTLPSLSFAPPPKKKHPSKSILWWGGGGGVGTAIAPPSSPPPISSYTL